MIKAGLQRRTTLRSYPEERITGFYLVVGPWMRHRIGQKGEFKQRPFVLRCGYSASIGMRHMRTLSCSMSINLRDKPEAD